MAFIAVLGAFIACNLSLPGVTISHVMALTAGAIITHNIPGPLKEQIFKAFDDPTDTAGDAAVKSVADRLRSVNTGAATKPALPPE